VKLIGLLRDIVYDGRRLPAGYIGWGHPEMEKTLGPNVVCDLTPGPYAAAGIGIYPFRRHATLFYQPCPDCAGQPSGRLTLCASCAGSGKVPM